tara:strand:+ start:1422 stop:1808 length:387 start_codon:yes stop_codon:yes gene_type:complete
MITSKKQGFILAIIILIIDQISKLIVIQNFNFTTNTGAAWGMFKNSQILLMVIAFIAIFYVNRYFAYHPLAFSMLLGGIFGNLTDRIFRGHVIDFINIKIFNYPLFNFADTFITISVFLIFIKVIKEK